MNLTTPMRIVGTSMGGTVVAMFAIKYPQYVSMICLMAPPRKFSYLFSYFNLRLIACKEYESDLLKQLRSGMSHVLLPETTEQFYTMIDLLVVKRVNMSKIFLDFLFKSRLQYLNEHKKCK
jgi:pimeloyl-ACP methyl ester carboxylesterase